MEFFKEVHHVRRNKADSKIESYNIRQSDLVKKFGWGIHRNEDGKLALVSLESPDYKRLEDSIKTAKSYCIKDINQSNENNNYTCTQIMRRCGQLGIPYDTVIESKYAEKLGWARPRGYVQYKDGKRGTKGKGIKIIPGKDTADLSEKQIIDLLSCTLESIQSFSWTIEHKDSAYKILDKSTFLHRGTGVPVEIRPFFLSHDMKAGERRNISLVHDGNAYLAHIDFESTDTARTRLFWNADFTSLLKSTFPYHYQQYSNNLKPDSEIVVRFKRLSDYEQYQVSFAGEVSVDTSTNDIEADELEDKGPQKEGAIKEYYGKRYERSPINRKKAIQIHGIACNVCGFNFEAVYGARGADYIDVHHVKQISTFTEEQYVDPQTDLITLCSNCHRMIHRKPNDILTVDQLKSIIQEMRQNV